MHLGAVDGGKDHVIDVAVVGAHLDELLHAWALGGVDADGIHRVVRVVERLEAFTLPQQ